MIKNKSEAIEYIEEQFKLRKECKKQYDELAEKIVGIEDEIELFRFQFNLSDEEMNEAYDGEWDRVKEW
jgi:hypothetical protein